MHVQVWIAIRLKKGSYFRNYSYLVFTHVRMSAIFLTTYNTEVVLIWALFSVSAMISLNMSYINIIILFFFSEIRHYDSFHAAFAALIRCLLTVLYDMRKTDKSNRTLLIIHEIIEKSYIAWENRRVKNYEKSTQCPLKVCQMFAQCTSNACPMSANVLLTKSLVLHGKTEKLEIRKSPPNVCSFFYWFWFGIIFTGRVNWSAKIWKGVIPMPSLL